MIIAESMIYSKLYSTVLYSYLLVKTIFFLFFIILSYRFNVLFYSSKHSARITRRKLIYFLSFYLSISFFLSLFLIFLSCLQTLDDSKPLFTVKNVQDVSICLITTSLCTAGQLDRPRNDSGRSSTRDVNPPWSRTSRLVCLYRAWLQYMTHVHCSLIAGSPMAASWANYTSVYLDHLQQLLLDYMVSLLVSLAISSIVFHFRLHSTNASKPKV